MKLTAALALSAALVASQDLASIPECGQTCVNNMIEIASRDFGCNNGDIACYCSNQDFGYGVRDCSNEYCTNPSDAGAAISYGFQYCANYVASATVTGSPDPTAPALSVLSSASEDNFEGGGATPTDSNASTGETGSPSGDDAESDSRESASSTLVTTTPFLATVSASDTTFVTTTGFSTVYSAITGSADSVTSATSSGASSLASEAASLASSTSDAVSSAAGSASSEIAGAASSASDAAASATSTGGAAEMMVGGPLLGAAGVAALLLL